MPLWEESKKTVFGGFKEPDHRKSEDGKLHGPPARWALLLGVLFFATYFGLALRFRGTPLYCWNDLCCESDVSRVVRDVTIPYSGHLRTSVHPLFVLFTNPIGHPLARILGSPTVAAGLLTSACGAVGVGLFFLLLDRFLPRRTDSVLGAVLYGSAGSSLLYGGVPETGTFAIPLLVLSYILLADETRDGKDRLVPWKLVGLGTFGVTVTNFVQTVICFVLAERERGEERRWTRTVGRVFALGSVVVLGGVVLALAQKMVYPGTRPFFLPRPLHEELSYTNGMFTHAPLRVLSEFFRTFFLSDLVLPEPKFFQFVPEPWKYPFPAMTFTGRLPASIFGWIALAGILFLLVRGLGVTRRTAVGNVVLTAASLSLLFNMALHLVYGNYRFGRIELFLYTPHFTFLVVLLVVSSACRPRMSTTVLLAVTALLMFGNNYSVLLSIVRYYRSITG